MRGLMMACVGIVVSVPVFAQEANTAPSAYDKYPQEAPAIIDQGSMNAAIAQCRDMSQTAQEIKDCMDQQRPILEKKAKAQAADMPTRDEMLKQLVEEENAKFDARATASGFMYQPANPDNNQEEQAKKKPE